MLLDVHSSSKKVWATKSNQPQLQGQEPNRCSSNNSKTNGEEEAKSKLSSLKWRRQLYALDQNKTAPMKAARRNRWCWWWWWFLRAEIRREWGVDAHARENMNGEKQMVFSSWEEDVMVRIVGALRDGGDVDDFSRQKWEEPCGEDDDRGGWGWWTRQTCLWMREAYLDKMERGQEWLSVG